MNDQNLADSFTKASAEMLESHQELSQELSDMRERMAIFENSLHINTNLTAANVQGTSEILDIFRSIKGGVKVLGWLGGFAKWATGLAAAFIAIYAFVQNLRGLK